MELCIPPYALHVIHFPTQKIPFETAEPVAL